MTEEPTCPGVGPRSNQPGSWTSVGTCTVPSRLRPRRDSGTVRPIAGMLSVTGVDRATPTGTAVVGGPAADGTAPVRTGPGSDWRCPRKTDQETACGDERQYRCDPPPSSRAALRNCNRRTQLIHLRSTCDDPVRRCVRAGGGDGRPGRSPRRLRGRQAARRSAPTPTVVRDAPPNPVWGEPRGTTLELATPLPDPEPDVPEPVAELTPDAEPPVPVPPDVADGAVVVVTGDVAAHVDSVMTLSSRVTAPF